MTGKKKPAGPGTIPSSQRVKAVRRASSNRFLSTDKAADGQTQTVIALRAYAPAYSYFRKQAGATDS